MNTVFPVKEPTPLISILGELPGEPEFVMFTPANFPWIELIGLAFGLSARSFAETVPILPVTFSFSEIHNQ